MRTILKQISKLRSSASQPVCPLERVVAAGPVDSVAELYSEYHSWLKGWLRGKLRCPDQAADLAHDTFVRLLTSAAHVHGKFDFREPRAFLTTVAKRLLIDHYRRRSLEQAWMETLALLPEPMMPAPEERLIILEALHRVDVMLDGLPAAVRSTFLLVQIEGLKYAEVAERLAISERTIKRHMVRALEQCILLVE